MRQLRVLKSALLKVILSFALLVSGVFPCIPVASAQGSSTISPMEAIYNRGKPSEISVTMTLNGTTLKRITAGPFNFLQRPGLDYTVSGNTVTFKTETLDSFAGTLFYPTDQPTLVNFDFNDGTTQTLSIRTIDTTTRIGPYYEYDKRNPSETNVSVNIYLDGDTTVEQIMPDFSSTPLVKNKDYWIEGGQLIIEEEYFYKLRAEDTTYTFTVTYSTGATSKLTVYAVDSLTNRGAPIYEPVVEFDKNPANQRDLVMPLNSFLRYVRTDRLLVKDVDYTYTAVGWWLTLTIKKEYMSTLPIGFMIFNLSYNGGPSDDFMLNIKDTTPQNSTINPNTADSDKKVGAQSDVDVALTLNGNTLAGITNGDKLLVQNTDYTVDGNTVSLRKAYLAGLAIGATTLTFQFSAGASQLLTINVSDTTPQNSTINPNTADFDKKVGAQADVDVTMTPNGNTLAAIANGDKPLVQNTDYTVDGNTVKLKKAYLAGLPIGATTLTFQFSAGASQLLTINVSDTTPQNSTINPNTADFDKKVGAQADVDVTMTPNGNTLAAIANGDKPLVQNTDYTVDGNTVKLKKAYLAGLPIGATTLTFQFSAGASQLLTINVSDTTPQNSTINPNTADFDKKVGAQADVDVAITLNGNTLAGITNGDKPLVQNTDYTVDGNTVKLKKAYLAGLAIEATTLTFQFSAGASQLLTINVSDTTPIVIGGGGGGGNIPNPEPNEPTPAPSVPTTPDPTKQPACTYTDINGHWAKEQICRAVSDGIVTVGADSLFYPDKPITRAEFILLLYQALHWKDDPTSVINEFSDYETIPDWALIAVRAAISLRVVHGYPDGLFRPNQELTRIETAAMLARARNLKPSRSGNTTPGFLDDDLIPSWGREDVIETVQAQLLLGSGQRFMPFALLTQAEAITIALRLIDSK
ncbi:X2-like carbohydrate binding domain-containing protein [Paenibacillus sp. strain BS8-2]